jgi:hypothetical protein
MYATEPLQAEWDIAAVLNRSETVERVGLGEDLFAVTIASCAEERSRMT